MELLLCRNSSKNIFAFIWTPQTQQNNTLIEICSAKTQVVFLSGYFIWSLLILNFEKFTYNMQIVLTSACLDFFQPFKQQCVCYQIWRAFYLFVCLFLVSAYLYALPCFYLPSDLGNNSEIICDTKEHKTRKHKRQMIGAKALSYQMPSMQVLQCMNGKVQLELYHSLKHLDKKTKQNKISNSNNQCGGRNIFPSLSSYSFHVKNFILC